MIETVRQSAKTSIRSGTAPSGTFRSAARVPQLDLLRGIAVLLVIGFHYPYFSLLGRIGWVGVDLFFVLSGFLISGLLFSDWKKYQTIHIKRFFIRRGFKIYPAFYAFILITLPLIVIRHRGESFRQISVECLFLQDYLPHPWGHTWSLGVEEKFYLVLPFLLLALSFTWKDRKNRGFDLIPYIAVALLLTCLGLRMIGPVECFHSRIDALFCGVALGYWFHFHRDSFVAFSRWWLLPLSLFLLLPIILFRPSGLAFSIALICNSLAFSGLLCWALTRKWVSVPLVERIGVYSYSIYLWHALAIMLASPMGFSLWGLLAVVGASCGIGILMAKLVEIPALTLRERWFPAGFQGYSATPTRAVVPAAAGRVPGTLAQDVARPE